MLLAAKPYKFIYRNITAIQLVNISIEVLPTAALAVKGGTGAGA
jgi:hypothetical protein